MKKHFNIGFTLIELLAIIVVLSGIFSLVIPQINKSLSERKIKDFNELSTSIENASKLYVSERYEFGVDEIPEYLTLGDLTGENYLNTPVIDPRSGAQFNPLTMITIAEDTEGVFVYTFDDSNIVPTVKYATMESNNNINNKYAKNGHTITLNITFNKEIVNTPTVTIAGRAATVTGTSKTRTATYTIPAGEATITEGNLAISISNYTDTSNVTGAAITSVTSGGYVVYDKTIPVYTSFYIGGSGNPDYIISTNTLLSSSVTGASQMCISTTASCSAWVAYSDLLPYTLVSGDGVKTLNVWYRDTAGNSTAMNTDTATLDSSAPVYTYAYIGGASNPDYITNVNTTLAFSAANAIEMCISTSISCSTWETYSATKAYTLATGDGTKTLYFWFRDLAGNPTDRYTDSVILDTVPPIYTYMYIGGSSNPTYINTLTPQLAASVSGSTEMCISTTTSCSAWETYNAAKVYTVASGDGTKILYVWYRDAAGNTTARYSDSVVLDTTAPTCVVSGGSSTWFNTDRTITGTCSDLNGCVQSFSHTFTSNIDTTTAGPGTSGGAITAFDNAGNSVSCAANQTVRIDKTPPVCNVAGGSSTWFNTNRTITGTCVDNVGGSGCSGADPSYTFTTDIDTTTAGPSASGAATTVMDAATNPATCAANQTVRIDKTAPVYTSFYIGGSGNPDYISTTNTILASSVTGATEMCISTTASCSSWEAYSSSKAYTVASGDGVKTLNVWYRDVAGNITAMQTDTVILDTVGPVYTYAYIGGAGNPTYITNINTTLAFSVTNVTEMCISTNTICSVWEAYSATKAYTVTAGDGTKTLYFWFRDSAGNATSMYSDSVILDTTGPICTVSGGSSTWYNTNRTITGTCSDSGSGCAGDISYTFTTDIDTTTAGPGAGGAAGTVYNNAGLPGTCAAAQTVRIDKTAPVYTSFYIGGSGNPTYIISVNTILSSSVTGATEMCISTTASCSSWEAYSASKAYTLVSGDGSKTLNVWYRDVAGNTTAMQTDTVTLDTVAPVYTYAYIGGSGNPTYITNANTTLAFSVANATEMCISTTTTCGTWEAYSATKAYTLTGGDGLKTLYFWFRDIAGNPTAMYSDTVTLDTGTPTCTVTGGSTSWFNTDRQITGTCSDSVSGCVGHIAYIFTSNTNTTTAGPGITDGGVGTVYDNAGNIGTCAANQTVKIDKTPPTCTVAGGDTAWTSVSRTVTGTCGDTGGSTCSTANQSHLFNTNINTTTAGPSSTGGAVTVYDVAGNGVSCLANQTVRVDTTAPSATISLGTTGSNSIVINGGGADGESNIVYYAFSSNNGSSYTANQAGSSYNFTGLTPGATYNFKVRTTNGSGLTTASSTATYTNTASYLRTYSFASWYRYNSSGFQSTSTMQAGSCNSCCSPCEGAGASGNNYTYVYPTAAMLSDISGATITSIRFYINRGASYGIYAARTLNIYSHNQPSGTSSLQANESISSIALAAGTAGWTGYMNLATAQTFAANLVSGARKGWVFLCEDLSNYQKIETDTLIEIGYTK